MLVYALMFLGLVLFAFPVFWMIVTSIKTLGAVHRQALLPSLSSGKTMWRFSELLRWECIYGIHLGIPFYVLLVLHSHHHLLPSALRDCAHVEAQSYSRLY